MDELKLFSGCPVIKGYVLEKKDGEKTFLCDYTLNISNPLHKKIEKLIDDYIIKNFTPNLKRPNNNHPYYLTVQIDDSDLVEFIIKSEKDIIKFYNYVSEVYNNDFFERAKIKTKEESKSK